MIGKIKLFIERKRIYFVVYFKLEYISHDTEAEVQKSLFIKCRPSELELELSKLDDRLEKGLWAKFSRLKSVTRL